MSGRLRVTFPRPRSEAAIGVEHARKIITKMEVSKIDRHRGNGAMLSPGEWTVMAGAMDDRHPMSREAAEVAAIYLNETFDRLRYTMDNPDVALSFTEDGTPCLSARDDSGIDHETLFKIGRVAR